MKKGGDGTHRRAPRKLLWQPPQCSSRLRAEESALRQPRSVARGSRAARGRTSVSDHGALVVAALLPHVVIGEERDVLAGRLGRVDERGGRVGDGVVAAAADRLVDDGLLAHLLDEPGRQLAARNWKRKGRVSDRVSNRTTGSARTDLLPESGRRERNAPSSSAPRRTLLTLRDMSDSSAADRPAALGLTMTSHRMPSRRHALTSCSGVSVRKSSSYICRRREMRVRVGRTRRWKRKEDAQGPP